MISGVYHPYVFVKKEVQPVTNEYLPADSDRQIFTMIDHLMGSRRQWSGINNRLIPSDASGRIPGMGSAGMAPQELRVRKFMESCTFKAAISCAGGKRIQGEIEHSPFCFSSRFCIGYWSGGVHR